MKTKRTTEFSPCRKYRYTLWREWDEGLLFLDMPERDPNAYLMVIGLNPSTADETHDDPTIRRCIGFAKQWGYGALCMTNLFAWRETNPEIMKEQPEPVGPNNDRWLQEIARGAGMVLAAWGKDGSHLNRAPTVLQMIEPIQPMMHLKRNADGSPGHPLYIPAHVEPKPYIL